MKLIRSLADKSDGGWWSSVFEHKVDARKDAHSNLLSKKATSGLYKIQCKLFFYKTVKADGLNYFSLTLNKCACVFFFFLHAGIFE